MKYINIMYLPGTNGMKHEFISNKILRKRTVLMQKHKSGPGFQFTNDQEESQ